jgi:Iap family predicted aminopeptidase
MYLKFIIISSFIFFFAKNAVVSQTNNDWNTIIGSAFLENKSYDILNQICDEAGGRIMGSLQNEKALKILENELTSLGYKPVLEKFKAPGWVRGNDEVTVKSPFLKKLKAVALGYVNVTPVFETELIFAGFGYEDDYKNIDANNKIVLVTRETPKDKDALLSNESIAIAISKGAKAILFMSDKPGTLVIARTGNFQGNSLKIPAFNISFEEGKWLQREFEKKVKLVVEINTRSYCQEAETGNLAVSLRGKVKDAIVIGAHIDSWDLGQGAIDNGQGTAILFDLARVFIKYFPENYYTINFVWFNGEELGLLGSKKYIDMHKNEKIIAMINMDMTGIPQGINCMGFDEFIPFFKDIAAKLNGFELKEGIISTPWTNSDHEPFMLQGIPSFSVMGHLEEDMYRYYHEMGDSFDKVNKTYISEAVAVIGIIIKELSNNKEVVYKIKTEREMSDILTRAHVDKTLKRQNEWYYK